MKRMAVPAALILISSGIVRSASMITDVSSQSLRFSGSVLPPLSAWIISARFDMLFDAGRSTVMSSRLGAVSLYCFIDFCRIYGAKLRIIFRISKKVAEKFGYFTKTMYLCTRIRQTRVGAKLK